MRISASESPLVIFVGVAASLDAIVCGDAGSGEFSAALAETDAASSRAAGSAIEIEMALTRSEPKLRLKRPLR